MYVERVRLHGKGTEVFNMVRISPMNTWQMMVVIAHVAVTATR